jgi:D-glycero-alpha-D-manno-heptose-7-phosphate kinase
LIIVQTPLRISFFGGGTDFPAYFREEGGAVVSTAIDKYIFVTIKQRFDDLLRVGYTRTEMVESVDDIQHELIREAFKLTGISRQVEISTMGDIPAGSGLGSSSTVTVGALHAMHAYRNEAYTPEQLAQEACKIELDILQKPIGIQDQYIAAYGGLRFFEFSPDGKVCNEPIYLSQEAQTQLNESLLLFFTGVTHPAEAILGEQKNNIHHRREILAQLRDMAYTARRELNAGNVDVIGELLSQSWRLKTRLASGISNSRLDGLLDLALQAGASGGKITGAGGGGFMMVYCPAERREDVRRALNELREIPVHLEPSGSKVIFDYRR